MALSVSSSPVAHDAESVITVLTTPYRAVYWSLSGSAGTLTPLSNMTNSEGKAAAVFAPDAADEGSSATITVSYGD